jgi:hypothetical protein
VVVDIDASREEVATLFADPASTTVTVDVCGSLAALPDGRTRLKSEQVFKFKGLWNAACGMLARGAIRKAHRGHMEAFKRFAERQQEGGQ